MRTLRTVPETEPKPAAVPVAPVRPQRSSAAQAQPDLVEVLRQGAGSRWRPSAWLIALLALSALAAGLWYWSGSSTTQTTQYLTTPAARGDVTVRVTATGSIQPTNTVSVSSELSGTVRTVLAGYNSRVTKGQVLAELDTERLGSMLASSQAKLAAAQARVVEAGAALEDAKLQAQRKQRLFALNAAPKADIDTAKSAVSKAAASLASAKADVDAAKANLKIDETNLGKTRIVSPIAGVVLVRNVDPGMTVAASLQAPELFQIAEDLTRMEVVVEVDEADVGAVREGQRATFSVDSYPDRTFEGTIRELRYGSQTVQGVVTYKAVITAANPDLLLRPGMTATAEITVEEVKQAVLVPNAALRFTPPAAGTQTSRSLFRMLLPGPPQSRPPSAAEPAGNSRKVWLLANGTISSVDVTIGATDGARTVVTTGGLEPGQAVVTGIAATGS